MNNSIFNLSMKTSNNTMDSTIMFMSNNLNPIQNNPQNNLNNSLQNIQNQNNQLNSNLMNKGGFSWK